MLNKCVTHQAHLIDWFYCYEMNEYFDVVLMTFNPERKNSQNKHRIFACIACLELFINLFNYELACELPIKCHPGKKSMHATNL